MSEGINTHWLMHYRVVALVNQCRRLIRDEFGTRLSLTDPELREQLGRFAARSQSAELARLLEHINREAGPSDDAAEADKANPPKRMYRGQPVPEPEAADPPRERTSASKTVMYRGRRVRG